MAAQTKEAMDAAVAGRRVEGEGALVPGSSHDPRIGRAPATRLADAAVERYGRLDAVVNTVGGTRYQGSPRDIDRAAYLETVELNTWPSIALVQQALGAGLADGGGAVVNVSSGTVNKTTPSMIAYAAAKAALNAVTRTLARDLGPLGVRVNDEAAAITGVVIDVDGGNHLQSGGWTPMA